MDTPPDFIFFDLAGTIDNLGVINLRTVGQYRGHPGIQLPEIPAV